MENLIGLPAYTHALALAYLASITDALSLQGLKPSAKGPVITETDSRGSGYELELVLTKDTQEIPETVAFMELLFMDAHECNSVGDGYAVYLGVVNAEGTQLLSSIPMNYTNEMLAKNEQELKKLIGMLPMDFHAVGEWIDV